MGNKATGLINLNSVRVASFRYNQPPIFGTISNPTVHRYSKGRGHVVHATNEWKEEFWHTPKGQHPIESSAKILSQSKQRYQFVPRWVLSIYSNGFTKSLARLNKPHSNGFPGVGAEAIAANRSRGENNKVTWSIGWADRTAHVGRDL